MILLHVSVSKYSLCTVSAVVTVLSESTVVVIGFHTFQLQLCCTVTDKAAAAVLAQDRVDVSSKHIMAAERFIFRESSLIGGTWLESEYIGRGLFCVVLC